MTDAREGTEPTMALNGEDYRLTMIAEKAAKEAVREAFRLLGLYDDNTYNKLREAVSWVEQQRMGEQERNATLSWASEQRRRGALMADTARKATIEKLITGAGVVLTAAASGAVVVYLASKGVHV